MVEFYALFTLVTLNADGTEAGIGTHVAFHEPQTEAEHLEFGEYLECLTMTGARFKLARHLTPNATGAQVAASGRALVIRRYASAPVPVPA